MTTTLATVKSSLRTALGRGTSQDANLLQYIKAAISHIERKRNWQWMKALVEVTNSLAATHKRTLALEDRRVRAIGLCRITEEAGEPLLSYKILSKVVDERQLDPPLEAAPTQYMLYRDDLILFNNTPDAVYKFEFSWWEFTRLSGTDATQHWLFDNFFDGVLAFATHYGAKATRDYERAGVELQLGERLLDDLVAQAEDEELMDSEAVMMPDFYAEPMP